MECGARGATLNKVEMRSYLASAHEQAMASHSRSLCDIITTPAVEEKIMEQISHADLFEEGSTCVLKCFNVDTPAVIRS